jgi:hypothetical protein
LPRRLRDRIAGRPRRHAMRGWRAGRAPGRGRRPRRPATCPFHRRAILAHTARLEKRCRRAILRYIACSDGNQCGEARCAPATAADGRLRAPSSSPERRRARIETWNARSLAAHRLGSLFASTAPTRVFVRRRTSSIRCPATLAGGGICHHVASEQAASAVDSTSTSRTRGVAAA